MNIVHVISTLNIGGAENVVVQLANEQVKNNNVSIVVLGCTDEKRNYIKMVNASINLFQLKWKKKYSLKQFFELKRLMNKLAPEVLHAHLHNPFYYVYGISFFNKKIKYIHTIHSSFYNWEKVLSYLNTLRFFNNSILHVCLSISILNLIKNNFPKLKSIVIGNGIKAYELKRESDAIKNFWEGFKILPEKGYQFLAIGNISDNKNFKLLVLGFQALAKQYPNAICIQVGKPTDQDLANELKKINASNVFLAGPHENAADFLAEADALIISSIQEGMPIVALEALSMGVPIITTPAGGMVDIINGENGLITTNFEAESLTKTISKYIELPMNRKEELVKNAKESFESYYAIEMINNRYMENYVLV